MKSPKPSRHPHHSTPSQTLKKARNLCFILDPLERRFHLSSTVESVDGTGNNLVHTTWGSAGTDLIRLTAAAYADGVSSPSLPNDLSARTISNLLNNQADPANLSADIATVDGNSLSDFGYAFGQFIDHDLDLTPDGGASFPIAVSATDPIGPSDLAFTRSQTDPATGTSTANPAQQTTVVTSYLDLSQVYGSSQVVSDALRTFKNGLLKTSPGNMLPYDNTSYFTAAQVTALNMSNDAEAAPESALFAAGDVRANENIELTALETLFVRNHNRIAGILQKDHPTWTDEQVYQDARKLNIAEYQNIVFNAWIPAVLGKNALAPYTGYNPNVNATIANEFSTVAFRFGHSLVSPDIARDGNDGQAITDDIPLSEDFDDPYLLNPNESTDPLTGLESTDIGPILKGDADGNGQAMDLMAVSGIRNLLFGNGGEGGDDLIARDVQRGRDNGMPSYNVMRAELGLKPITSFSQISSNITIQKEFAEAYPGGVNTIDAFEGGMAEAPVPGSDVGPLFQAIMVNQFTRLRDGDRFYFGNETFNSEETAILHQDTTLGDVIKSNTNITNLQSNVFIFKASISGTVAPGQLPPPPPGAPGAPPPLQLAGLTVELQDSTGDILATTKTDARGNYSFNQLSGPASDIENNAGVSATGTYKVVLVLPSGTKMASNTIEISSGDTNIQGTNFTLDLLSPTQLKPV